MLEDEERKVLQFKDAKQKQHEQLELQKSAFEVEMQMERQAFLFLKEKNAYSDRRKLNLDRAFAQAAEDKGSELFRRELLLTQTGYDRSIHSAARASVTINQKALIAMMVQKEITAATRTVAAGMAATKMAAAGMAAAGMTTAKTTTAKATTAAAATTTTTTTTVMITMMECEREN